MAKKKYDDADVYGVSVSKLGKVMQAERKIAGYSNAYKLADAIFETTGYETNGEKIKSYEGAYAECSISYLAAFCITCAARNGDKDWLRFFCNVMKRSMGDSLKDAIEREELQRQIQAAANGKAFLSLLKAANDPDYTGWFTEVLGRDADGREIVATTKNDPNQQGQTPPIGGLE